MDTSYFHMQQQIGLTMIGLLVCYLLVGYVVEQINKGIKK